MTRWHKLGHAHHGFWEEPGESASAVITASSTIGPATTFTASLLFDGNLLVSTGGTTTYGLPCQLTAFLSAATVTSHSTLNFGLDAFFNQSITFQNPVALNALLTTQPSASVSLSLSSLLNFSGVQKTTGYDSVLSFNVSHFTDTLTLNAILLAQISGSARVSLDSLLNFSAVPKTSQFNAVLFSAATTLKTASLDASLSGSAVTTTKTFGANAELLKGFTKTALLDGLLSRTATRDTNLDALVLSAAHVTTTLGLDSALSGSAVTTTKTFGGDAELLNPITVVSFLDGLLSNSLTRTFNADATVLKPVQTTRFAGLDAALLSQEMLTINIFDAVLVKVTNFNSQVGLNASLLRSIHPFVSLQGLLQLQVPTTGADAVLVSGTNVGTTTISTIGLDARIQDVNIIGGGVDAVIGGTFVSFDGELLQTYVFGPSLDANLVIPYCGSVDMDAVLFVGTATHTLAASMGAELKTSICGSIDMNAVLIP